MLAAAPSTTLVLGGGGFIGAHLVRALLNNGARVRVLERPYRDRTPLLPAAAALEWHEGDFGNAQDVRRALDGVGTVYHLVSTTQPQSSNDDPVFDVRSNLLGTLGILEQLRGRSGVKVIFVSSGGTVYGLPLETPIPETHRTEPICSYGVVKLAIEKYLEINRAMHGLDYRVLRLANPYGPWQEANRTQGVVGAYLSRILRDEPLEVWGDGSVVRDYLYVGDAVEALLRVAKYGGDGRIFNVGSGRGHSLRELISEIEAVTGRTARVRYTAARRVDIPTNILDISLARAELGWVPAVALRDGLTMTCAALGERLP